MRATASRWLILSSLFLALWVQLALAQQYDLDPVKVDLFWSGGVPNPFCTSQCPNVTNTSFQCSSDPAWNGTIHFKDPLGSLYLVSSVNITLYGHFNCANSTSPGLYIILDQTQVAQVSLPGDDFDCTCPFCDQQSITVASDTWEYTGWPGYIPGGWNNISVLLGTETIICLSRLSITLIFVPAQYGDWIIQTLTPPLGELDGGTQIMVFGENLPNGPNVTCNFGTEATPALYVDSLQTICTSPPSNSSKSVPFVLASGGLISRGAPLTFTYYNTPQITSLHPVSGVATGGTVVTISGSGFLNSTYLTCKFGSQYSMYSTFISSTQVQCTSPPMTTHLFADVSPPSVYNVSVTVSEDLVLWIPVSTYSYTQPVSPKPRITTLDIAIWATSAGAVIVAFVTLFVCAIRQRMQSDAASGYEIIRGGDGGSNENVDRLVADIKQINPAELTLGERIGKGSFGEVFRAAWRATEVAVKKINLPALVDEAFVREFRNEIDIMRRVSHPNVVQFLGASLRPPDVFIVTEYMSRGSLYRILHDQTQLLAWELRKRIVIDAARGMCYLHSNVPVIIHRDLKSHNLLIDEHWKTKVSDFGLSKIITENGSGAQLTACGTPCWTAPEVITHQTYTSKADVYSFGIVLWEIVSREDPFKGMPPFQVVYAVGSRGLRPNIPHSCPPQWALLIARCWAADPESRPSFVELLEQLDALDVAGWIALPPPPPSSSSVPPSPQGKNQAKDEDKEEAEYFATKAKLPSSPAVQTPPLFGTPSLENGVLSPPPGPLKAEGSRTTKL